MVSAKYTEETPLKEVDFTAAAGAGAEAWAKEAQKTQEDSYKILYQKRMADAVVDGQLEGAKAEPQPASNWTEYGRRHNQAMQETYKSQVMMQGNKQLLSIYSQERNKPYTPENQNTYQQINESYINSTVDRVPDELKATTRQTLNTLATSYQNQYMKAGYKQQLQNSQFTFRNTAEEGKNNIVAATYQGGLPTEVANNAFNSQAKYILTAPGVTGASREQHLKSLGDATSESIINATNNNAQNRYQEAVASQNLEGQKLWGDALGMYQTPEGRTGLYNVFKKLHPNQAHVADPQKIYTLLEHIGNKNKHILSAQGEYWKGKYDDGFAGLKLGKVVPSGDINGLVSTNYDSGKVAELEAGNYFLQTTLPQARTRIGGLQDLLNKTNTPWKRQLILNDMKSLHDNPAAFGNTVKGDSPPVVTIPFSAEQSKLESEDTTANVRDPDLGINIVKGVYRQDQLAAIKTYTTERDRQVDSLGGHPRFLTNAQSKRLVGNIRTMTDPNDRAAAWKRIRPYSSPTDIVENAEGSKRDDMVVAMYPDHPELWTLMFNRGAIRNDAKTSELTKDVYASGEDTLAANPLLNNIRNGMGPKQFETFKSLVTTQMHTQALGNESPDLPHTSMHPGLNLLGLGFPTAYDAKIQNNIISNDLKNMGLIQASDSFFIPQEINGHPMNGALIGKFSTQLQAIAHEYAYVAPGQAPLSLGEQMANQMIGGSLTLGLTQDTAAVDKYINAGGPRIQTYNEAAKMTTYGRNGWAIRNGVNDIMFFKNKDGTEGSPMIGNTADLQRVVDGKETLKELMTKAGKVDYGR